MTLGLDLSDGTVRAVVVNAQTQVLGRGDAAPGTGAPSLAAAAAIRRALAGAGVTVTRAAVAMPHAGDSMPPEIAAVLGELLPDAPAPAAVNAGLASAVAEQWCGAARGLSTIIALSTGEHVTSGVILNGTPWTGAHGLAGSVGWLAINPVEREDYRRLGGLEAEVSSSGIVRRIIWRIKSGDESVIAQQHRGDLSRVTASHVFQAARSGDGVSISVIKDTAKYIGMALSNLMAILDPEAIVLGGMLATSGDVFLESIRLECRRRLGPAQVERIRIVLSPLGSDAAAIGAARIAHQSQ
jgi:predicted NBD/HSP70 family sugar kinase